MKPLCPIPCLAAQLCAGILPAAQPAADNIIPDYSQTERSQLPEGPRVCNSPAQGMPKKSDIRLHASSPLVQASYKLAVPASGLLLGGYFGGIKVDSTRFRDAFVDRLGETLPGEAYFLNIPRSFAADTNRGTLRNNGGKRIG